MPEKQDPKNCPHGGEIVGGVCDLCGYKIPEAEETRESARTEPAPGGAEHDGGAITGEPVEDLPEKVFVDGARPVERFSEPEPVDDGAAAKDRELEALRLGLPPNEDVTILITRKADANLRQFKKPCQAECYCGSIVWGRGPIDEAYRQVQELFGGGRYRMQLRYGIGTKETWHIVLSDPPEPPQQEPPPDNRLLHPAPMPLGIPAATAAAPVLTQSDLIEQFIKDEEQREKLRNLFAPKSTGDAAPAMSAKDTLLLEMVRSAPEDSEIRKQVTQKLIGWVEPAAGDDNGEWGWGKIFSFGLSHQKEIVELAKTVGEPVLGLLMPRKKPEPPPPPVINLPAGMAPMPAGMAVNEGKPVPFLNPAAEPVSEPPPGELSIEPVPVITHAAPKPFRRISLKRDRKKDA